MKKLLFILFSFISFSASAQWSIIRANPYTGSNSLGYIGVVWDSSGYSKLAHLRVSDLLGGGSGEPVITPSNTIKQYWNGYKQFVVLNTDSIAEGGTNQYWTTARFDTRFATKTTDNLTEGSTNKYDKTVAFTNGGNISITGAYPNFTLTNGVTNNNQLANGAGYLTSNGLPNVVNSLQVINAGGALSFASGLLSARPTVGTANRFYYATDNGIIYFDNGTTWAIAHGALSGDITSPANSLVTTLATVNANVFGSNTLLKFSVNGKGLVTGAASVVAGDIPTLNQNTSGSAGSISGTNVITNSNLSQMVAHTYKGNNTASTGNVLDLTQAQLTAELNTFTTTLNGLVPAPATSNTTDFLRRDGSWAAPSSSGMANPMTTLGDIIVENATPTPARLAGSTSATKQFLTQTGNGSVSALPGWNTIAVGDVPTLNQNTTGTADHVSGTNVITNTNLSQMAANTFKANNTSSTANAADITVTQAKTLLNYVAADIPTLAPLASPTFTGTPTLPTGSIATTQTAGNSSTAIATTAFVATSFAPLASPTFTGTPAAPTASAGTNTTQLATTAFVGTALQMNSLSGNATTTAATNTNTNLIFTIGVSEIWVLEYDLSVQCSSTGGVKIQITAPAGATVEGWYTSSTAAITTPSIQRITAINALTGTATHTVATTPGADHIWVRVKNSTTSGTCGLGFASGTSTQTTTIFAGSTFKRWKVTEL